MACKVRRGREAVTHPRILKFKLGNKVFYFSFHIGVSFSKANEIPLEENVQN